METFQLSAFIDGIKTLKSKTLKITLETQDISMFTPEQLANLFKLNDSQMWVAFSKMEVQPDDLDIKEVKVDGRKSPSTRLRNSLYVLWEKGKQDEDFELYYIRQMEKFIKHVKDKLN